MSRNVSSTFKSIMEQQVLPQTRIRVKFGIEAVGASEDVTLTTSNTQTEFSDVTTIVDNSLPTIDYMTQELNSYKLGSEKRVMVENATYEQNMFCPDVVSDDDCEFNTTNGYTMAFGNTYNMVGLTLTFDNLSYTYPSEITVNGYANNVLVKTVTAYPTSYNWQLSEQFASIDKLTMTFNKTNLPNARARLAQVYFGLVNVSTEANIEQISQSFKISPINNELYKSEFVYKLDNFGKEFDIDNPTGIYEYITEQQPIKVEYSLDGEEWVQAGIYLTEGTAKIQDNLAEIKAIDHIQFMNDTYYKDVYRTSNISLYNLAKNVLEDFGWELNEQGEYPYRLDNGLKTIYTVGTLPVATHAECLQIIAFAANMTLYEDDEGYICIKPLSNAVGDVDYYVDFSYMSEPPTPEKIQPLAQIDMAVHTYVPKDSSEVLYKVQYTNTGTQTYLIDYDFSTNHIVSIVGDGTLSSSTMYARKCELTVVGTGTYTILIEGKRIEDNIFTHTRTYNNGNGEVAPYDNPLITNNTLASNCVTYIGNYLTNRIRYKIKWLEDYRVNIGDLVRLKSEYTDNLIGRVISMKTNEPDLLGELEVVIINA